MSQQNVFDQPWNIRKHKIAGFLNALADKVKTGTIHLWNGTEFVCWGQKNGKWVIITLHGEVK